MGGIVRDFSQDGIEELESLVKEVEEDGQWKIIDNICDLGLEFSEAIGKLNIEDHLDDLKSYHKNIIDKEDCGIEQLNKIIQNVKNVDEEYSEKMKEINKVLEEYSSKVKRLKEIMTPGAIICDTSKVKKMLNYKSKELKDSEIKIKEDFVESFVEKYQAFAKKINEEYKGLIELQDGENIFGNLDGLSEEEIIDKKYEICKRIIAELNRKIHGGNEDMGFEIKNTVLNFLENLNNVGDEIFRDNLKNNKDIENKIKDGLGEKDEDGYILNQKSTNIGKMKLGSETVSAAGCECIATYNALNALLDNRPLCEIINYYESNGMMANGNLGVNPLGVKDFFDKEGYSTIVSNDSSKFDEIGSKNSVVVLSFWNEEWTNNGLHTIALVKQGNGKFRAYNNDEGKDKEYDSISQFFEENNTKTPIDVIGIS